MKQTHFSWKDKKLGRKSYEQSQRYKINDLKCETHKMATFSFFTNKTRKSNLDKGHFMYGYIVIAKMGRAVINEGMIFGNQWPLKVYTRNTIILLGRL